jgi:hypothetical protein
VQSNVRQINQCTLISEGSLVFIEFEEQLIDSLNIPESVVEGSVVSGARIFRASRPLIPGARSYVSYHGCSSGHDLVLYRVSCPIDPGYF